MTSISLAVAADAPNIAALYRAAYPQKEGQPVGCGYPFPQYMNPDWLSFEFGQGRFLWLVARCEGELAGCLGAIKNISAPHCDDRVAELTGLVVGERWRQLGIARALLGAIVAALKPYADVFLAETRTGNVGGWKGTLKAGFFPIGFEPIAHRMLGQLEPMLMMENITPAALAQRRCNYNTSVAVHELAAVCLAPFGAAIPRSRPEKYSSAQHGAAEVLRLKAADSLRKDLPRWLFSRPHASAVVGMSRICGSDSEGSRFVGQYMIATVGERIVGIAELSVDLHDLRARLLFLEVENDGLQALFLSKIVTHLSEDSRFAGLATIVLDVRADYPSFHLSLEKLGFFPTIYYPALVATAEGRVDGVQFTLVLRPELIEAFQTGAVFEQQVQNIVTTVFKARCAAFKRVTGVE